MHGLQPNAKIKKLSAENRKSNRKHEQEQFSASYWSAQPRQNITSGLPYTTHNTASTATQPHRSPVNSQQADDNNTPDVLGLLFPGVRAKAKIIEGDFSMMPSRMRLEVCSQYSLKFDPGASTLDATTSMGGPTTSRGRNAVVSACCCGGSLLPSARFSPRVQSFERSVGCSSPLPFACISLFTF